MFAKSLFHQVHKSSSLIHHQIQSFTIFPRRILNQIDHLMDPVLDLYALKMKKMLLDRSLLEKNKLVVPPVRLRQYDDTLESLMKNNLCAGVIHARDEFEDVDLVFDIKQAAYVTRVKYNTIRPFLIPVGDDMIKCIFHEVFKNHGQNRILQIRFNRFIVGKPNLVYIPFRIKWDTASSTMSMPTVMLNTEGVWVYVYNEDYPAVLDVEAAHILPSMNLTLGDYLKSLPSGLVPHPRYKNLLYQKMLFFRPGAQAMIYEKLEIDSIKTLLMKEEAGEDTTALREEMFGALDKKEVTEEDLKKEEEKKKRQEERKKAAEKRSPRSFKKRVLAVGYQVKEGLRLDEGEKKPAKGTKREG